MGQITTGRVRVVNDSPIVQAMWNLNLGTITGTSSNLVTGAEVLWGTTGTPDKGRGIISENDAGNLWLYRKIRQGTDGFATASSTTFVSGQAEFVAGDANAAITIQGAGASGAELSTTIASVTNAYTVVLAAAAQTSGASLTWSMTTGDPPEVGQILKLVSDTNTFATIEQIAAGSPPNWATSLTGIVGAPIFSIRDNASAAVTLATNAAGPIASADTLTLSREWPSDTISNVDYGISFDFTPNLALPLISYGDVDSPALISTAFRELDLAYGAQVKFSGALIRANAAQDIGASAWTTITVLDTEEYNDGGWVAASGDSFFTVPAGVTRVRLMAQLDLEEAGGVLYQAARIVRDTGSGIEEFAGAAGQSGYDDGTDTLPPNRLVAMTAPISVSAGHKFYVQIISEAGQDIENNVSSWFSIEAVSFR